MIKKWGIIFCLIVLIFTADAQVNICYSNDYTLPFSDNANRPANINPGTVITTNSHGMWVVTQGSYYGGSQTTEVACFYQDGGEIKMAYMSCGVTFTVIPMPDPSPIISATMRPANMNPGTVLILENGQVWKVIDGSYYGGSSKREVVIVYEMYLTKYMSFQTSGVTMEVQLISFSDVPPGFWAYDYIMAIYDAGITTGYADGTYRPFENISRAQMAAFIIRAKFGEDFSYSSTQHFSDIPNTHWAFKYIQKMYDEGITTGYEDGTYRPSQNVTRAQMATFIARALFGDSFSYNPTSHFSDVPDTHGLFKYIQKMYDEGITTGYEDGTYRPSQNVTRAQMATFIARAFLGMP